MKRPEFLETKRTPRYSLRKLNVGVASVLLGVTIFGINFTDHSVKAATKAATTVESVGIPNGSPSSPNSNSQQTSAVVLPTAERTKGINAIGAVKVPSLTDSQNDANKAIDDALNNKKSEINGATTIDQTTKDKLNQAATDAADKAKEATTNNDVATEQTNTQKATSATGKVQQSSASNNAIANNSTEAATTSSTKAKQTTQTATKNSDNTKVSSNTTNKENSQPTDKTTNTQVVSTIDKTLASLLTKLLATTYPTGDSASDSSTLPKSDLPKSDLPKSDQTVTKVTDPMMEDYKNRGGENTWIDQTVADGAWDYPSLAENAIFGDTGIIKTNPRKYFFAGYADFSEQYHRIILFARGQDASDKNLYTYVVHTYNDNVQPQTETPNETAPEIEYRGVLGIGGSTYNLQVHNYNGESFSVVLKGFKYGDQGGYGLTPIFDQGILNPKYKDKTLPELDGTSGINYKEQISRWASVIPQETTTSVRYVDLETGKDIAQPLIVSGFGYQGFKINGNAPKIDGYTLVSSPKTLGLSYEDGIIAPYKVGQTYTQYITDDVYVKQTVLDTDGTVRATAYYNGQPLGASASKILGHNDSMSFMAGDQSYTYNNRINNVDAAMVYYYQKVGEEGKSQLRVHYIDVTKDTYDSQYAPGDGVPASGQEMNPLTYTGNIGDTYDYATNAKIPEGYVLVGTSPNLKGTFSKSDHDAYIYVKIDRNGAKATIENLTHLNHAQKQAAKATIDQATDLNTMNQAISTATTLDGDMGKLSDLTADLTNTNNYKYASDKPKSTVATDYTNADVLLDKDDKTAGQNADDATVLKLIDQINTDKSSLDGDTNLSAAETTISGLTHLNDAQRSAANQAVTNASDLTGLKTAVGNAQSVDSAMSDLQTAVNQANEAKTTNNYLQASADKKDNLNSAVQNAQAVLAATGANDSANQVKALTKSVNDAVDALDGDANTKKQADQNIDDVAKAAKQAIDNTNGITESEKQAAKGQVDADAQAAKQAIGQAKSNKAVTDAVNNGTVAIDKVSANAAIDGALAEKNNSIDGAPNLTDEEKKAVKGQAKTVADSAKTNISKASTVTDVESAKNTGVENIKNMPIPTSSKTKNDANSALDTTADAAKKAIDKTSGLTADQKQTAKDQIDQAVADAKGNIKKASDDTGVAAATDAGKLAIDKVSANAAIDGALAEKNNSIDGAPNLTAEEKKAVKGQAKTAADSAKTNISNAKTVTDVESAKKTGVDNINNVNVPTTSATKDAAIKAIDDALADKKTAISGTNLTDEEKSTLVGQAQKLADDAIANINKETTNDAVNTAKDNGVQAIKNMNVPTTSATKDAAIKAIDDALADKKTAISGTNLTDEEKSTLVGQAQKLADDAIANINKETTNDAVNTAKDNGVQAIKNMNVPTTSATKDAAIKAIDDALADKKTAISGTNLTDEEKSTLVGQAQKLADDAIANINKETTNDAVNTAKDNSVQAIKNMPIPTSSKTKNDANSALDTTADAAKKAIDKTSGLTADQKQTAKDQIDQAVADAKGNIKKASDDTGVAAATDAGKLAIDKVSANAAIDGALAEKNNSIDGAPNLTAEEKKAVKGQAKTAADSAKTNISNAKTVTDVESAKKTGVDNINNVNVPTTSATKDAAIKAIDDALADKKTAISGTNLTDEEKSTLVGQAQKLADDAIANINKETTNDAVNTAKDNGVQAIKNMNVPTTSATKDAAIKAIDDALADKKTAISGTNLTDEEKSTLVGQAQKLADDAIANINKETTNDAVNTAKDNGVQAIKNMNVPTTSATKDAAIKAIDDALADKKTAISGTNLTDEEKSTLVGQAQKLADDAIANINKETTNDAVNTAKDNSVQAIKNMPIPTSSKTKNDANSALDTTADAAKKAIDKTSGLTADQKQTAKDQIDQAVADAKGNIKKASDDTGVAAATDAGKLAIDKVSANAAIDGALAEKNNSIDGAPNLTAEEKKAVKGQAKTAADSAKTNISNAKTVTDVESAKKTGVDNINNVNVPTTSATKDAAIKAIDDALADKKTAISGTNLTDEEKSTLVGQAQKLADDAIANINKETTNDAVNTAKDNSVQAIKNMPIPTSSKTKNDANSALDTTADAAKKAIDKTSGLTADQKQTAKDQIDQAVADAKGNIKKASDDTGVAAATDAGKLAIDKVSANAAIDGALAEKNNSIDGAPNLTAEEKKAVKDQAKTVADSAKTDISNASTVGDVTTAQTNGEKAINAVEIPTASKTKNDANSDLDNTADAAKKAIDETLGLTDDQKQTAKDQIDQAVDDAKENINKASDEKGVANATDAGKLAIDKVSAKAAIDAAVAAKKSKIAKAPLTAEEAKPLNDLVDQEADAAKDAIDAATTNAVVEAAKNNGVETINNINVPATSATKDDVNKAIDDALAKKIEEINNANLTDDQKQSLIDQAQNAANQAKENVRSASIDEDVQTAKNNGIAAINGITVKSNSVDDQDNSATNEGNGNQAGHIQSDNSSDVTKHSSTQQSGNEKDQLPQTGNETQRGAGLVGLAIAGLAVLLGSAGFRKKRD
ncbi:DUF1542 domain-containing protein [Limosilactobacillus reuteri]